MKNENNTGSTDPSADEIRGTTAKLSALRQTMTVLAPLTAAEREGHRSARVGLKNLRTLMNRVAVVRENRKLLPPAFEMRRFEEDAAQAMALGECLVVIDELRGAVRDTLLAVGHRANMAASAAYAHIKVASNSAERINPTADRIARRDRRSTVKGIEPAEVPKPAESADPPVTPTDQAA